jgi:uncharacterized protein (TIGR02466 family)
MPEIETLFATRLYRAELDDDALLAELDASCRVAAEDDEAGRAWSAEHGYPGYTSYASLDDLPWRFPAFRTLAKRLDRHVAAFGKGEAWDLGRAKLALDDIWINVLPPGGAHGSHLHPNAVVSGTVYVAVPAGASAIRFEDPRLALMMAAPPRRPKAPRDRRPFVEVAPRPGTILLWESFVRHEVPLNRGTEPRISVSFNYARR